MADQINNRLITMLEGIIDRIESGEIDGVTVGYRTKSGENRVICSEGDFPIPEKLNEQFEGMAEKIAGKEN